MQDKADHRTPAQDAAKLRKKIHKAAKSGDRTHLNEALRELYSESGPLNGNGVNRPETFGPIVEAAAIAVLENHNEIADDMWDNIKHLYKGYGLTKADVDAIADVLDLCEGQIDPEIAAEQACVLLEPTKLRGRVKLNRHVY